MSPSNASLLEAVAAMAKRRCAARGSWAWTCKGGLVLLAGMVCGASAIEAPVDAAQQALRSLPRRMAWAWERDEDLRWLPRDAGVAYVATTVRIEGDGVTVRGRRNSLWLAPATMRVPVVHVDASTASPPELNSAQREAIVAEVLRAAQASPSKVVQLDFEARLSQRGFLRETVGDARRALPADVALSVTALASWCAGDRWMSDLPADEVVPMAFRMSRDSGVLRAMLARQGNFAAAECRVAVGTATDEPLAGLTAPRRYVFSSRPWSFAAWQSHPF